VVPRAPRGDRLGLVFSSQIAAPKIPGDDGAGIEVLESYGAALRAGISAGDRVVALNEVTIRRLEDYDKAISRLPRGAVAALLVAGEGRQRYVALATQDEP